MSGHTFQVDLRGIVDLLSHHLYSSPRVYVRELMQNSVDAVTARRRLDPGSAGRIRIEPPETTGDGSLRVHDDGIGLTEAQVHELLTTIGGSAKRDDLGYARHEFLGQFGIGLLSCFLVSDDIEVRTRSAAEPDAPAVAWHGHSDGRYTIAEGPADIESGTTVTLRPRPGTEHWLSGRVVRELADLHTLGCTPQVRAFEPPTAPALYLESVTWRAYTEEVEARAQATDAWSALLGTPSAEPVDTRDVLMLDHNNPLVRRLLSLTDPDLVRLAVEVLYGQTPLTGRRPLRPADTAALSRSFLGLLDRAMGVTEQGGGQ